MKYIYNKMNLVKLNPDNAPKYIGFNIIFKTDGDYMLKKIISASKTSVKIDYPRLKNSLEIRHRDIHVIIP